MTAVGWLEHEIKDWIYQRGSEREQGIGRRKRTEMGIEAQPDTKLLRIAQVRELTGLSRSTIWRLERSGQFPKRVNIIPMRASA
ncbi:MAG: AlpA family phage regulatory protein [Acidobacteria bacterium]|nr:AlpA family phage regulatory protein [Acidobacteriota bacterium]